MEELLEVRNLKTYFYTDDGVVPAVDGVEIRISKGETLGLVGESACGKSVTALSIMRLIPTPPGKIINGEAIFKGTDLLKLPEKDMRKIRGSRISMIFQEPMTSLNPVYTIGDQIMEVILLHQNLTKLDAFEKTIEMLKLVGIPDTEKRVKDYPHQLSGGMRQRAMIAMALSCNPDLLIADEATTALDVTIQAQILELMKALKKRINMSILLITHNLAVVAEMADFIAIMYAGKIMEYAQARSIYKIPHHPYTWGLLNSIPKVTQARSKKPLTTIEGVVPNPYHLPPGCKFNPRCNFATSRCKEEEPLLEEIRPNHFVRCWNPIREGREV